MDNETRRSQAIQMQAKIAEFLEQVERAKQAKASNPVNPVNTANPVNPANTANPANPVSPANPANPASAIAPVPPSAPPTQVGEKSAVANCNSAYRKAFQLAQNQNKENYYCGKAGNLAYREAMPPLIGADNIRNFIACVAGGMLLEYIPASDGTRLLYAAQIAHAATEKPFPPRVGRPPAAVTRS